MPLSKHIIKNILVKSHSKRVHTVDQQAYNWHDDRSSLQQIPEKEKDIPLTEFYSLDT